MATEAHAPTRERRFKKLFLDPAGRHLDADEIEAVTALGIEIDGEIMQVDLEGFDETVLKRLIFDGSMIVLPALCMLRSPPPRAATKRRP